MERLAHTYSIIARDPKTGQLGIGVQSHAFACGAIVPWAEAGIWTVGVGLDTCRKNIAAGPGSAARRRSPQQCQAGSYDR